ncbi:hypothetical protein ONZ45_g15541 [Pleurotus djamor]|nr:hypothetical protein ONZ45_g15541 [Pleurotus djamor]
MVIASSLTGFGLSLQVFVNSQANGFVGVLKDNELKLGILYASYGLGAFASPLVSTQFSELPHWSYHYIVSAVMAVFNVAALVAVFKFKTQDGWIVTFIINERDGGPSAGYISSGFFGGQSPSLLLLEDRHVRLTLGRVGLLWLNKLVGERRVIFVYTLLAIGLEVTIWFVPSIIQNALAVSFIGVLFGPMFPIIISQATRIFPRRLLTACIGWVVGIGTAGSAALPLLTGLLASRYGISSLQPLMVSMMCTMVGVWTFVPAGQRPVD